MPSPIAHVTVGYLLYRIYRDRVSGPTLVRVASMPILLLATATLSLLPDLASAWGLIAGEFARFHNNWEHSLAVATVLAAGVGVTARFLSSGVPWRWAQLAFLCYGFHVIMDFLTIGRGVMILWPFSDQRFSPPIKLFYGLHWSDGWITHRHLWTLITEVAFVAIVALLIRFLYPTPEPERFPPCESE